MIELRWKLEAPMPNKGRDIRYTLQWRELRGYMDASGALNVANAKWSKWQDVPYTDPTMSASES